MSSVSHPNLDASDSPNGLTMVARIAACAVLTAVAARFAFYVPFTPVPVTLQVAAVLFSGLVLGSRGGFAAQALYLMAGFAGAPVFAAGHGGALYLFGALSSGYLLSYPLAAWLVGRLVETRSKEDRRTPFVACAAGIGAIYSIGCLWLGLWLHLSFLDTLLKGAGWFLIWDMAKAMFAILVANGLNHRNRHSAI